MPEEGSPQKPRPSIPDILARATLQASPRLAGSLSILYEGARDRWASRGTDVLAAASAVADTATIVARTAQDAQLDAALSAAVEAGTRSGLVAKRRLLGRVVGRAVLDDARVDEATLVVGILSQIDAPHVRCLELLARAEVVARSSGELEEVADGAERPLVQRIVDVGTAQPQPVLAALVSLGLIETTSTWGGSMMVLGVTPFGQHLLDDLREAGAVED